MRNKKIHIYTIAKNESKHCERWVKSCAGADGMHVLDTGSADSTVELLTSLGVHVETQTFNPWRFDVARNEALKLLPADADIAVILDLDEVLCDGWRSIIEKAWDSVPGTTEIRHLYAWSPHHVFQNSRVHTANGYVWKKPIHEVQVHTEGKPVAVYIKDKLIVHMPDGAKSRAQYLDLLKAATEEDKTDERSSVYYGRELYFNRKWSEAITELKRYLSLPTATWSHERSFAYQIIGVCFSSLLMNTESEHNLLRAVAEEPCRREAWYHLGDHYRTIGMFLNGYASAMRGMSVVKRPYYYIDEQKVWTYGMHDLASVCAFYSGLKDESRVHALRAFLAEPEDKRLINNLVLVNKS